MEFLKEVLGEHYEAAAAAIKAHNDNPENKEKQIKLGNLASGEYVGKSKYDGVLAAKTTLEGQLQTATDTLKGFEGVDVKELQGKISALSGELETQKGTYETQIADMEFKTAIQEAIKNAGGRSAKAVMAELDVDVLKSSKNQVADIQAALDKCKETNAWMFGENEPINNPVAPTGSTTPHAADSNTITLRAAMGLGTEKK